MDPWKLLTSLLEVLPRVNGVWHEAFKPREGRGLQTHWEVESFGEVGSPETLIATE
jgi:hypothetical protein